jgi:hypothetical protein
LAQINVVTAFVGKGQRAIARRAGGTSDPRNDADNSCQHHPQRSWPSPPECTHNHPSNYPGTFRINFRYQPALATIQQFSRNFHFEPEFSFCLADLDYL